MTTDRASALAAILALPSDPVFAREYLERGGSYSTFHGDPIKQATLKRELPLRYVVTTQMERREE